MDRIHLLTVEATFYIGSDLPPERRILIIHPDFSVPPLGWKNRIEPVTVLRPDGRELEAMAQISLSHFNIPDPTVSIDQRWRVTVAFFGMTNDDVPEGSKILVSQETRDLLCF